MRRIALVFCIVFLIIDVVLLAWVKPYAKTMLGKLQIQVSCEKGEVANAVKTKLEARGLQVKLEANVVQSRNVVKGYKVYATNSDPALLAPVLETLKHDHIQAKMIGNEIVVGVFPTEAKAQNSLKKVSKFGFQIGENIKAVDMKIFVVSCEADGTEAAEAIKADLADVKGLKPEDIKATAVTPP